jgi:Domain of unknown function (DUF4388)
MGSPFGTNGEDDDDLAIRGEIETSSIPELLRSFLASGEAGILTVQNGDDAKSVYIDRGKVVYASSNNPDERLGESLLLRGKITARQYVEASKEIRPGRRLGAILVDMEAIESEELLPAVEHQVKDLVLGLLSWTRGDYAFVIKDLDQGRLVPLNVSSENLILEGIRRSRSWSQIQKGLGDIESIYVPTGNTEVLYRLELSEEEQEVLAHVNGTSTVEQICQVSYLPNFETCKILWAFQVLGVIRKGGAGSAESAQRAEREGALDLEDVVEKFNQMFGRVYAFLRGRIEDEIDPFMEDVLEQVSREYGVLFAGVDLKQYGRADFDQMLANVADLPADQRRSLMIAGLNELAAIIQLTVRTKRGAQEEAVVSGIIKDGLRRVAGS